MSGVDVAGYLRDESCLTGTADEVVLALSETDIIRTLRSAQERGCPVTVQGGLTGITGAGVPQGGVVLNLAGMTALKGIREVGQGFVMTVEPGCTLDAVRRVLLDPASHVPEGWSEADLATWHRLCEAPTHIFAPDLTEAGATLGGVVSTNGSGARSYYHGAARDHIEALRLVLVGGDVLLVRRGREKADGCSFVLETESGRVLRGVLPSYAMPAVKHAAGLFSRPGMDLLDLFVGSEGILAVVSEIEIRIRERPEPVCGLTAFLPTESAALALVQQVRASTLPILALEYFSAEALDLLRAYRADLGSVAVPELPDHWHTALYMEMAGHTDNDIENLLGLLEEAGGCAEDSWFSEGYETIETFKSIRHAIPETVNRLIAERRKQWPDLTKLGTDLAVPDECLDAVMEMYHTDLRAADLPYLIFGHIGNNHVHVNILPRDRDDWVKGKALYGEWARRVIGWGGTVSAEHGIGKLKAGMLADLFGQEGIREMQAIKAVFDPGCLLNRGTLFDPPD